VGRAAWLRDRGGARAARGAQLEKLSAERDRLNIEWGQLQLEQSAWSNHGFVERVASDRLRMTLPAPGDVRIVAQ